ncbi:M4 family metallopeptidase, partial [Candidatus Sumerlaeota bacterium]|nr:M4 family metallopeptidase [Candidatus Sumerlaeota bacterium]
MARNRGTYDVVWTGGAFFVAYCAEQLGLSMQIFYKMLDLDGNEIRPEARAFASTDPLGPRVAWNGITFAMTGIKNAGLEGNKLYIRFFNAAGNPLAAEAQFGSMYASGATVSWQGDKFVAAYGMPVDVYANSAVILKTYSATGAVIDSDYQLTPVAYPMGSYLPINLKMVGDGDKILLQGQYPADSWGLSVCPVVYPATGDVVTPFPPCVICPATRNGFQDNAPVVFQWLPVARNNNYRVQVANNQQFNNPLSDRTFGTTTWGAVNLSQLASGQGIAPGTRLYWRVKGSSTTYTQTLSFLVDPNIWISPLTVNVGIGPGSQSSGFRSTSDAAKFAVAEKQLAKYAQDTVKVLSFNPQGTPQYIVGKFALDPKTPTKQSVSAFLNTIKDVLALQEPDKELADLPSYSDNLGHNHHRFEQTYEGIPIWSSRLHVHLDKTGQIYALNGDTYPTPQKAVDARLDAKEAEKIARQMANRPSAQARSQMVWFPAEGDLHLAWKVDLRDGIDFYSTYIVDATTGRVFIYFSNLQTAYPGTYTTGRATTSLSSPVTVPLYRYSGVYQPVLRTDWYDNSDPLVFQVTNPAGGIMDEGIVAYQAHGAFLYLNSSRWIPGRRYAADLFSFVSTALNEPMVADLMRYMKTTLDFYKTRYGWRSWDNKGGGIVVFCHTPDPSTGGGYENAYFSPPGYFVFGDGSDPTNRRIFSAADDVVAHEFTHGVTASCSDLIYLCMSGAANEGMSDIIPQGIDRGDWLEGEDLVKSTDPAYIHRFVRSLQDPTWGGVWNPNDLSKGGQPAHMNAYWLVGPEKDNGGVHINSGIINKAGYELAQRTSRDTMVDVFFRANTVYLTPDSQFIDVRRACVQAATDLYPGQAAKVTAVRQAFDAVGITDAGTLAGPVLDSPANRATLSTTVTLSWNAVAGAKYYMVELSADVDFGPALTAMFPLFVLQTPATNTRLEVGSLGNPGSKWYWRVRSDQSQWSAVREFTYGNTYIEGEAHIVPIYSQGAAPVTVTTVTKQGVSPWLSFMTEYNLPRQIPAAGKMLLQVVVNPT